MCVQLPGVEEQNARKSPNRSCAGVPVPAINKWVLTYIRGTDGKFSLLYPVLAINKWDLPYIRGIDDKFSLLYPAAAVNKWVLTYIRGIDDKFSLLYPAAAVNKWVLLYIRGINGKFSLLYPVPAVNKWDFHSEFNGHFGLAQRSHFMIWILDKTCFKKLGCAWAVILYPAIPYGRSLDVLGTLLKSQQISARMPK